MKYYNTKHFFKILFSLHKSDTLKILGPSLLGMTLYSYSIYYLEIEYLKLTERSVIKNLGLFNTLLGFVLSLLLVFRTNTAYDRWWEGRKLWGKLVNDSRNFAVKMNGILGEDELENRLFFQRHLAYFPHSLSRHLTKEWTKMALDRDYSSVERVFRHHAPLEIVNAMGRRLSRMHREGKISGEELVYLDRQLSGFMDVCGGCERIKNTPIPYSYSSFVKKFIIIYVLMLPIAYVVSIGWLMIPLTVFVFFVLMSLEVIAEEIEDPFNNDENDLPTEQLAQNIEKNIDLIFKNIEFDEETEA
ncbi:bestrophin family protein [Bergeyella sp. RCAD1439]|uniref:bestrophin family protein n=1 Tax=Bergeyella anatis TaxID=3113737 RepID=UPI002E173D90|nr:bestrophin family ion channel [Bergeyella sp. RCAD1439]